MFDKQMLKPTLADLLWVEQISQGDKTIFEKRYAILQKSLTKQDVATLMGVWTQVTCLQKLVEIAAQNNWNDLIWQTALNCPQDTVKNFVTHTNYAWVSAAFGFAKLECQTNAMLQCDTFENTKECCEKNWCKTVQKIQRTPQYTQKSTSLLACGMLYETFVGDCKQFSATIENLNAGHTGVAA